jgi:hypothetical protein
MSAAAAAAPVLSLPRGGFTPVRNESLLDWPRLLSGNVQFFAVMYINSEIHVPRESGAPVPKWTRPITHAELAAVCRCSIRAVEVKLKDLTDRKVLEFKRTATGTRYHIPFETWPGLPDIPSQVVSIDDGLPISDSEDEDQADPKPKDGIVHKFEPHRLKAGRKSRPSIFPQATEKVQYETDTDGVVVSERMIDGVLIASIIVRECIEKAKGEQTGKPQKNVGSSRVKPTPSTKAYFAPLHALLDDYCLSHHGIIPNEELLSKIQRALGEATVGQFRIVIQAKMRAGKVIPMGLFVNLAEDARLASEVKKSVPARREPTEEEIFPDDRIVELLKDLAKDPSDTVARKILEGLSQARIERITQQLKGGRKP